MVINRKEQRRNSLVFALAEYPPGSVVLLSDLASVLKMSDDELNATVADSRTQGLLTNTFGSVSLSQQGRSFLQILRDEMVENLEDEKETKRIQNMMSQIQAEQSAKKESEDRVAKAKSEPIEKPTVSPADGIKRLKLQLEKGNQLLTGPFTDGKFDAWKIASDSALAGAFGRNSDTHNEVSQRNYITAASLGYGREEDEQKYRNSLLTSYMERIEGAIAILEQQIEITTTIAAPTNNTDMSKVFVVHGRDEMAKTKVEAFLRKLKLNPIILHQQDTKGKGILDKLTMHGDVGFAIVLMTGDDVGALKEAPDTLQPRARQNVILELGYFIARLGREKVCALYEKGVERPSDFDSVYVEFDEKDAWRTELARELRAASIPFDPHDFF